MHAIHDSRSILAAALLSATALACGGGTTFSAGVNGDTQAKDLSDADVQTLCMNAEETAEAFFEDNKDGFCKFGGAVAGIFAAGFGGGDAATACEMAVASCEAQDASEPTTCEPAAENCAATVAEIEACYNDSLELTETLLDGFAGKSCAELVADEGSLNVNQAAPASCTALEEKCPSLSYGGVSVGTSTTT